MKSVKNSVKKYILQIYINIIILEIYIMYIILHILKHMKNICDFILNYSRKTWKAEMIFLLPTLDCRNISLCFRLFMEDLNKSLCETGSKYNFDLSAEPEQQCGGYKLV